MLFTVFRASFFNLSTSLASKPTTRKKAAQLLIVQTQASEDGGKTLVVLFTNLLILFID